jgi:hypothetical protein
MEGTTLTCLETYSDAKKRTLISIVKNPDQHFFSFFSFLTKKKCQTAARIRTETYGMMQCDTIPFSFEDVPLTSSLASSRGVSQISQVRLSNGLSKVHTEQLQNPSSISGASTGATAGCCTGTELRELPDKLRQTTKSENSRCDAHMQRRTDDYLRKSIDVADAVCKSEGTIQSKS